MVKDDKHSHAVRVMRIRDMLDGGSGNTSAAAVSLLYVPEIRIDSRCARVDHGAIRDICTPCRSAHVVREGGPPRSRFTLHTQPRRCSRAERCLGEWCLN